MVQMQEVRSCAEMMLLHFDRHRLRFLLKGEALEKPPEPKVPDKTKKAPAAQKK